MATRQQKEIAWGKGTPIPGKNPNLHRKDRYGNEIYKPAYGKKGEKSWEVDHSHPKSKGGTDSPRNLQAMQTSANRRKGSRYPIERLVTAQQIPPKPSLRRPAPRRR